MLYSKLTCTSCRRRHSKHGTGALLIDNQRHTVEQPGILNGDETPMGRGWM